MYKLLKNVNPEINTWTRAILYVIGIGGFVHLTTLLVIALTDKTLAYFNPFYAVDIDQLLPGSEDSYLVFFIGWGVFALGIYAMRSLLVKRK